MLRIAGAHKLVVALKLRGAHKLPAKKVVQPRAEKVSVSVSAEFDWSE
ncbi:hypothetical protein GCM10025779_06390 [Arthrobacter cryoconiti]